MSPSLRLGRYLAEGLLGPGGVTETYLARLAQGTEEAQSQLFALKLLRQDRIAEPVYAEVARRFLAAGEVLHGFRRPGFGKVVDLSGAAGSVFIVSEYVPGLDLGRLAAISQSEGDGRAVVDPALAGLLVAEIARLLHVGHTARPSFPHLGLSPQNVMVTEEGEVVLLDAGLSASLRLLTEQAAERWWFVAPELTGVDVGAAAIGERQGVAADLYSLGALIYYLVTGRPPREAAGADSSSPNLPPPELEGVSSQLAAAVRRLLATDPEDRPESAAVLVDWLSGGISSVRGRQRLIAEAMRAAEEEARRAAAARAQQSEAVAITLPVARGGEQVRSGPRGRVGRRRVWTLAILAASVAAGVAFLLAWPGPWGQGSGQKDMMLAERERVAARVGDEQSARAQAGGGLDEPVSTREELLSRLAGRLVAETVPPGATVWVDGVAQGTTFADLEVGPGRHRVALTLPGYRTFRDTIDTSHGAIIRRKLVALPAAERSGGFVRVECGTVGKYPILLDDEETGWLCPQLAMPTTVGKHVVGIYLPGERRVVSVAVTVEAGSRPVSARFAE